MKPNSRAYNRKVSWKKALRKKRIDSEIYHSPFYDNLHQYSKNKIHCSCPDCSPKTKRRRKNSQYETTKKGYFFKISELKKQISMDQDEKEWDQES